MSSINEYTDLKSQPCRHAEPKPSHSIRACVFSVCCEIFMTSNAVKEIRIWWVQIFLFKKRVKPPKTLQPEKYESLKSHYTSGIPKWELPTLLSLTELDWGRKILAEKKILPPISTAQSSGVSISRANVHQKKIYCKIKAFQESVKVEVNNVSIHWSSINKTFWPERSIWPGAKW